MTTLNVLLFGPARDALNCNSIPVEVNELPLAVSDLRQLVSVQHARLNPVLANSVFAVGNKMIPRRMEGEAKVASFTVDIVVVPPVSGG